MLKVAIVVPTRGNMPKEFVFSLTSMCIVTASQIDGLEIGVMFGECTYIHRNRNDLARMAIDSGATHMLWLDDDMQFPPDLLIRLLKQNKPIVGCNYVTRDIRPQPITILHTGTTEGHPPERLWTLPDDVGLVSVDAVGFGAVLIQTQVFEKIAEPWFENYLVKESPVGPYWVGEDADFCQKARAAGFTILVDQRMSQAIGHVDRKFTYLHAHALAVKDEQEEAPANGAVD